MGGNIRCDNCAMGRYSVTAAANCEVCKAGTYSMSPEGAAVCDFCVAGKKSETDGAIHCDLCNPGESSQGTYDTADPSVQTAGPIRCKKCLAGTRAEFGGGLCTDCNAGKYSKEGAALCKLCVTPRTDYGPGHRSGPASPDCTACASGK